MSQTTPVADRLAAAMAAAGIKQAELVKRARLSAGYLSYILSGKRRPSRRTLDDIARALGVSTEWLETGRGAMRPAPLPVQPSTGSWTGDLRPCVAGSPIEDVIPDHTFDPDQAIDRAWRELEAARREDIMLTLHRMAVVASFIRQVLPPTTAEKLINELSKEASRYLDSAF